MKQAGLSGQGSRGPLQGYIPKNSMGGSHLNSSWFFLIDYLKVHFWHHNDLICRKSVSSGIVYFDHE